MLHSVQTRHCISNIFAIQYACGKLDASFFFFLCCHSTLHSLLSLSPVFPLLPPSLLPPSSLPPSLSPSLLPPSSLPPLSLLPPSSLPPPSLLSPSSLPPLRWPSGCSEITSRSWLRSGQSRQPQGLLSNGCLQKGTM